MENRLFLHGTIATGTGSLLGLNRARDIRAKKHGYILSSFIVLSLYGRAFILENIEPFGLLFVIPSRQRVQTGAFVSVCGM